MKYNLKNPGVKRILREAKELANNKPYEYSAQPLEDNIFEWHFTVRGPKDTEFENGRYHGRILLPTEYPFKPPEIIFLTPNGRFELHTKICLSITGFHPEYWQPAWGIRTVLLAIIGFFPTEAKGAIGSLQYDKALRRKLAKSSIDWVCSVCGQNMKDALSDEPNESTITQNLGNNNEEIPRFEITYKPENNDTTTTKESESAVCQSDNTDNQSTTCSTNERQMDAGADLLPESRTVDSDSQTGESSSHKLKCRRVNGQQSNDSDARNTAAGRNENNVCDNGRPLSVISPLWLDALIALLISIIVALLVHRYLM